MSDRTIQAEASAPGGSIARELSAEIAGLASVAESGPSFVKQVCTKIVTAFRSPYGAVSIRLGSTIVEDYWHTGGTDPKFWKKPVDEILDESLQNAQPVARQFTSHDARFRIGLVSVILRDLGGSMIGVLSLVTRIDEEHQGPAQRELLEALGTQISLGLAMIERRSSGSSAQAPTNELSKAAGYRSGVELAFALASSLRNKFGCDQVAIGFSRSARARVVAVSGLDDVSERSEAVRNIADAMGETLDRRLPTVCQRGEHCGYRVHKRWHDASGGVPVATVPLDAGEGCTLLVALRRAGDMPFRSDEIEQVSETVAPYAPAFEMLERATRSVGAHARAAMNSQAQELVRPGGWFKKAAVIGTLVTAGWVAFGTLDHRVSTPASVLPAQQRHIATPFAGTLAAVLVAPGDDVQEGQLLAQLDTASLEVERDELTAEIAIARLNEDRAIAEGISADAALARAERTRAEARLTEIERRIEQSSILAPFTGRVVQGDFRRRVGESLPVGEPMFEIANTTRWTIEIEVPQRVAGDLAAGQTGQFATNARPESASSISVDRVNPLPEIRGGRSVYIAEAEMIDPDGWLKPGMEGAARVSLGEKPVWWVASHRFVNYMRMNFWL